MFIKLTRAGGHSYAQLVESFRNEEGKPRQRTVATIGRLDETGGAVDSLLNGLLRATGRKPVGSEATPQVRFESALALGDVWALDQLWRELSFDALAGVFRKARYTTPSMNWRAITPSLATRVRHQIPEIADFSDASLIESTT